MVKVLLVVVGIGLIFWLNRIRKRGVFKRYKGVERSVTGIHGFEIQTMLSSATPLECLRHDGLRFGESFRLKVSPPLPHNQQCQCQVVSLSYTSTEVFDGALRNNSERATAIGSLSYKEAHLLKEMLKTLHSDLPPDFEEYCQQFELDDLPPDLREKMTGLVREKFVRLQAPASKPSSPSEKVYQG
ncbi:MAG: hypothetical protein HQM13_20575 [SAR324 cluster bacterium]|nr:hypothetical protein [SAR324 cluster bacterium]